MKKKILIIKNDPRDPSQYSTLQLNVIITDVLWNKVSRRDNRRCNYRIKRSVGYINLAFLETSFALIYCTRCAWQAKKNWKKIAWLQKGFSRAYANFFWWKCCAKSM